MYCEGNGKILRLINNFLHVYILHKVPFMNEETRFRYHNNYSLIQQLE